MKRHLPPCGGFACIAWLAPTVAQAHSFTTPYVLPVPFWMYVYGCAATLIVTFALLGYFVTSPAISTAPAQTGPGVIRDVFIPPWLLWLLRAGALGCLLLTIVAGVIGTTNAEDNIGMSLFWVFFLLGFTYVTPFIGNVYALIDPWRTATSGIERLGFDLSTPRLRLPEQMGYWFALGLYCGFIWMELFTDSRPFTLSLALIVYSVITLFGVAFFGKEAWFCRGDLFGILFELVSKLAPLEYVVADDRRSWVLRRRLRPRGADEPARHMSLVFFILLMLSSTTYDAVRDTTWWIGLFWRNLLSLLQPLWGEDLGRAQALLMEWYLLYQKAGLLLFFVLYLGLYLLVLLAVKAVARTIAPVRGLALDFCYAVLPIAVAYSFTHYFTLVLVQVQRLPKLLSDPFGFGWNMWGLSGGSVTSWLPMSVIWHVQVAVLLAGHLVSAYLAHVVAVRRFGDPRSVIVNQIPLLALMVTYTIVGLWILSLPLGAEVG